jgi:outer membrane protein assembly factor BamB
MKSKGRRFRVYLAVAVMVLTVSFLMLPATSFAQGSGPADSPWPMFRHDLQHTGHSPYSGPQDPTALWRYGTGDQIHSSPAIGPDGTIYFGSLDNYFYALDSDGNKKWRFKMKGQVYSSPAVGADGTIYVGCNDQWFYAINPDGTQKWKFATGDYIQTSPAIGPDGTIYVGSTDDTLYAFDPDGALKWSYEMEGNIFSSPAIGSDGTIYVGCDSQYLYAFNPDGSIKWRYGTLMGMDSSPAIGPDGTIYVGTDWGDFHAVNPNGTVKWRYPENAQLGTIYSSPAIGADGTIYFGCYDDTFYALEPDGSLKWKYKASDNFKSSPAIGADGTVYVGCLDGYLYAFEPDGDRKWRYKAGQVYSSPIIGAGGVIYFGSADHHLYALGEGYEPQSPIPVFEFSPQSPQAGMQIVFDASASNDPDGSIEEYAWDFGDGETGSGSLVTHTYEAVSGYIVTLSITDNDGYTESETMALTIGKTLLPVASFEFWPEVPATGEKVAFDASASSDPDGSIEKYEWDFGDDETGSGSLVTHTYGAPGDYNVTITLTDNNGFVGEKTMTLTVSEIMFPIASFEFLPREPQVGVEIAFDASASQDPDGTIKKYEWDFGDGETGSGEMTSHAYETGGGFNVTLTVIDNDDFSKSITGLITVGEITLPVASFEFWPQEPAGGEKVAFDASGSQISGGTIETYEWDFGDGETGSGELVSHVYQEPGEYQVTLTLTDDSDNTTSEIMSIVVASLEGDDSDDSGIPFWVWIIVAGAVIAAGYGAFYWRQKKSAVQQDPE